MEIFGDYSYYYNIFYEDKDYQKEAGVVKKFADAFWHGEERISRIIDIGCGTGRHDIVLAQTWDGIHIDGIDISNKMIDIAKAKAYNHGLGINYSCCDIRKYKTNCCYDMAFSLFHVMSYMNSNEDIICAFKSIRDSLKSDGLFVFDVWYGPGVLTDRPVIRIKRKNYDGKEIMRVATPVIYANKNVVDVNYEIVIIDKHSQRANIIKETHSMRYFFYPEIEFYLKNTGFKLEQCVDCNTLDKTDFNSWTAYFVARAI